MAWVLGFSVHRNAYLWADTAVSRHQPIYFTSNPVWYRLQYVPGQFCRGPKITQRVSGRSAYEHTLPSTTHALPVASEIVQFQRKLNHADSKVYGANMGPT